MEPLPPPLLARQIEVDPLHGAVGEALHDATITLWADLWQRLERYDQAADRIESVIDRLVATLDAMPWFEGKTRVRRRLHRARQDLREARP